MEQLTEMEHDYDQNNHDRLFDINEWVRRGVGSLRSVERLLALGIIPRPIRLGRNRRWSGEQIDRWIREQVEQVGDGEPAAPVGRPRTRGPLRGN